MVNTSQCCAASTTCTSADIYTLAIKVIAASQCCFTDEFTSDVLRDKVCFNFIIVGGGSAGNVVASRLSEVKGWNVLLLEAGPKTPIMASVPKLNKYLFNTKYDWNYTTINNNRTSQGITNGQVPWPRGKVLGGTSILNGMLYVKGRREDYQSWYDEGNPSWNPENVYYHERKAESLQNHELRSNPNVSKCYGKNGELCINRFNSTRRPLLNKILESWDSLHIKSVIDPNTAEYRFPGLCGNQTVTAANGVRCDTARCYLLPIRKRNNLKIVTDAFVTKVLIDENKKAYGVEVIINGRRMQIFAINEVILSAGTINSPQLLMLSGIGPKNHLESKNISCKVNLRAVGKNLQDHVRILVPVFGDISNLDNRNETNCAVEKYCCNRTGYLAQGNLDDIQSFYSLNKYLKYPEFQNHVGIVFENVKDFISSLGYKISAAESLVKFNTNKTLYAFFVSLLHPKSTGSVLLNTSNPSDKPIIDANYFGDKRDLILTAKGILILTKIVNTKFFKSINAFVQRIKWPECDKLIFNTIDYWTCYGKNFVTSIYHPVGTCKMGPNPGSSVVDDNLKVHGVKCLRVIDASVMPKLPSGNTNGPTIMIGEMGADMVKRRYNVIKFNYENDNTFD